MKVVYTEAAQQELENFQKKQQEMLEKLIAERKYVFGDGTLEVTASDVKETADLIRPVPRLNKRARSIQMIGIVYAVVGSLIAAGSFLYPRFLQLLHDNRNQALLAVSGLLMAVTGFVALLAGRLREREVEAERRFIQLQTQDKLSTKEHVSAHVTRQR